MEEMRIVFAGFGGQGLLFAGKVVAYAGLIEDREVSWLPSYGPEMRGGTANCSVTVSDEPIGSPLIMDPNNLIAMNQPSVEKFGPTVVPGGTIVIDSTLAMNGAEGVEIADGVNVITFKATEMAEEAGLKGLANIICLGKLWAETHFCTRETLDAALEKCVPPKKQHLLEPNKRALQMGIDL